jgi:uncharacterized membrane protein
MTPVDMIQFALIAALIVTVGWGKMVAAVKALITGK